MKNEQAIMHERSVNHYITYIVIFLYAFYALKTTWLAFDDIDLSPINYYTGKLLIFLSLPCFVILIIFKKRLSIPTNVLLTILPFINWSIVVFHHYDEADLNVAKETLILFVLISFTLFPLDLKIRTFELFYKIIIITSAISIVLYVLYATGIDIGFSIEDYYGQRQNAWYVKWLIFAIYQNNSELRLCGIFNEPGGLGTVCGLLFAGRYRYSKKWEKILLLVTIGFTFSLAGFLLVVAFYAMKIIRAKRNNPGLLMMLTMSSLLLILLLPRIDFGNEMINHFFDRLEIIDGKMAGDNRQYVVPPAIYDEFIKSSEALFGKGIGYFLTIGAGLSYKIFVLDYGILGFSFLVAAWLLTAWRESKGNADCHDFLLIFTISLYQRPYLLTSIYGYVLLFGGISWIRDKEREESLELGSAITSIAKEHGSN